MRSCAHCRPPSQTNPPFRRYVYTGLLALDRRSNRSCLDGSAAAYYFRQGAEKSKFYIHTQGGGYCVTNTDCAARAKTDLGSSRGYPTSQSLSNDYFSTDAAKNPLLHNWTLIYSALEDDGGGAERRHSAHSARTR